MLVIGRQAAGRHDTVHVGMTDQRLPPRVEDAEDADLRPQMARVGGDLAQRGRTRLKEPGVQLRGVAIAQRQQRMRERKDDMHVRHVEQLALARVQPALPRLRLTLRAVPVSTRVIGDGLMPAGVAPIEVAAERGRATARDRAEHGRCCTLSHGCCSRKVSPCAWRTSATSTAGRLTTARVSAGDGTAVPPAAAGRAIARAG